MENQELNYKILNATKWSTITEVISKIISPLTNMILARILIPEAFGVVTTVTMIISFAEVFTDSGFQKYLIQHEFKNEDEKYKNANVAFWTNLLISIVLWIIIIIFSENLADLVGNHGLGNVIIIACIQLPLTSFSSIQMSLFRREFDFKTLFYVRIVSIFIPFFVTIPLAYLGFSYWSLIIGNLTMQFSNAIILTVKSKWKPKMYYNIKELQNMISYSLWLLVESISVWLTTWIDSFIIGNSFSQYYLGIYKTSTSMVNTLMSLITSSIIPVLFSSLSRIQDSDKKFKDTYFKFQRLVSVIVFPLGVGVYLYSDLATKILLGSKWSEASTVIGIWALTSSIQIVLAHFSSEAFRAKGKPKISFLAQMLHLIVLVPACIISSKYGFWTLIYTRSWIRMQGVIILMLLLKCILGISIKNTIINVLPTAISSFIMGVIGFLLKQISNGILWSFVSIILCALSYFVILFMFTNIRNEIISLIFNMLPPKTLKAIMNIKNRL